METQTIQLLPPLVAERIAAGEVIERPASVVKELVENSIDAGATEIEVRLAKGGCELIEVLDNGSGMSSPDLEISVCRHATSKIKSFEDLNRLVSLGFRGEALPSIASVSELQITSRVKGAADTHEIRVAHQAPVRAQAKRSANIDFVGSPHGTRIRVLSLFSQIPARLKFLKSAGAESNAVREVIERLALTHPEIRFSLTSDDRKSLDLPAETLAKRTERMLGNGNPYDVRHVKLDGSWSVEIIWLKGLSLPHTRSLYQIVNGRALRDRIVQQAILSPLRQSFLPGNFPAMVVKLDIPGDQLDVNAHPTKSEIRFLESGKVFAILNAAIDQLLKESTPREVLFGSAAPGEGFGHGTVSAGRPSFYYDQPAAAFSWSGESGVQSAAATTFATPDLREQPLLNAESGSETPVAWNHSPFGQYKGILFSTYFVFEQGEELLLIDQHAGHERIRYEKLKKSILKEDKIEEQQLLVPEVIKFPREQVLELAPKLPLLKKLGFDVEVFGEDSFVFRALPAVWGTQNLSSRLKNLLERLDFITTPNTEQVVWDETLFEKIAMEACRSSFKAGDRIPEASAIDLTSKLMSCDHPGNCPHGRPTFIRIHESKFEEWFNRKV